MAEWPGAVDPMQAGQGSPAASSSSPLSPIPPPPRCPLHPDEPRTAVCTACGRTFCRRCAGNLPGPLPDECPTCEMVETTAFLDAADESRWPDLL